MIQSLFLCPKPDVVVWKLKPIHDLINSFKGRSMESFMGIQITDIGDDYINSCMPVNKKTKQPMGLLHGGTSCVLAATLGSIGGAFCVNPTKQMGLGLTLNVNQLGGVKERYVTGTARDLDIGETT